MFAVYWVKPQKQIKEYHGSYNTFEQAMQSIRDWWHYNGFTPPYYRIMHNPLGITIDYGSHYCFYHITQEDN